MTAPFPDWLPAQLPLTWLVALGLNGLLVGLAQRLPLLTPAGWCHAAILGTILWGTLGPRGWLAVVAYLAVGSLVTRLGFQRKQQQGLAERTHRTHAAAPLHTTRTQVRIAVP